MRVVDPYAFHERAAIREFDAGFSREEAERLARRDITGHHSGCGCDRCEPLFLTHGQLSGADRQDRPASVSRAFAGTLPSPRTVSGGSCSSLEGSGTLPEPS